MSYTHLMMRELSPSFFFNLDCFDHASLFEGVEYVWEALDNLKGYLSQARLGQLEGTVSEQAILIDPQTISIGPGTQVEPGAYIKGPCIIGANCQIRQGAYLRGNIITGNHCVIGHATEIKGSILLNHASAAHFNYVGDAILGNETNLGAGTKCANLRFDGKSIAVHIGGQRVDTGRRKLGLILGDHGQTGCNAVPNPGTLMAPYSWCLPNLSFGGYAPPKHGVRSSGLL